MHAERKVIGARLRAAREALIEPDGNRCSREGMARRLRAAEDDSQLRADMPHVKSLAHMIKEWENGKHGVSPPYRRRYLRALGKTEEELFGLEDAARTTLWRPVPTDLNGQFSPDDEERLMLVARRPRRVDRTVVESLATILAAQRRTEDVIGSAPLVGPVRAQLATIHGLISGARGPLRPEVVNVAAQWAQFAGWLHIATGDLDAARTWLDRAAEWAIEVGDIRMVGSVTSWKAYLAQRTGGIGAMIGMAQAAQRNRMGPGRAYDLYLEARGHAISGDLADAERVLGEAGEATAAARAEDARPWEYYYLSPGFFDLERGLVLRYMGRADPAHNGPAVQHLTAGRSALPADMRDSEWGAVYLYHQAIAHLQADDADPACTAVADALTIARTTMSESLLTRLRHLHTRLALQWPDHAQVAELGEALR